MIVIEILGWITAVGLMLMTITFGLVFAAAFGMSLGHTRTKK